MFTIINWMFAISTSIQIFKNRAADNKIKRQGNMISHDERSVTEIVSSFIKDYFYLLVPGYNIIKSIKTFITNDTEYANKRLSKLKEYERISPAQVKKEEPKASLPKIKENIKNKVDEIGNGIKNNVEFNKELPKINRKESILKNMDQIFDIIENSNDMVLINEIKTIYRQKSIELRKKYDELSNFPNTKEEKEKIVRRVKLYDAIFVSARDRLVFLSNNKTQVNRH